MTQDQTPAQQAAEMLERTKRLERWYLLDGRDDPSHEHHMTYTGLALKYRGQS